MKKILALGLSCLLICGSASGAVIEPDSYDKLFLRCNGTTTTFVDSSTANPKTITANGNATQIPVLEAGKPQAMFFNGTTDYVDIANSADFAFGVGAFEIEFSFMTNKAATAQTIIDNRTATADTNAWLVNIINSSGNKLCFTTATTARITGTTTLAINTKYRCKIVGNGGANGSRTVIMYLAVGDGDYAQEGSTYTADYNFAKQTLRIGSVKAAAGTYYNGWLKNLTLKKATTTVLDMRGNTTATSPLGPAIAFDGTGDYLDFSDSADFAPGTGAFTVEAYFKDTGSVSNGVIYDTGNNTSHTTAFQLRRLSASGILVFIVSNNVVITGTRVTTLNSWHHVKIVGNGGADGARTVQMYVDGVQDGSTWTNNYNFTDQGLTIGTPKTSGHDFKGYMREIIATKAGSQILYIKGDEDNGVTTFVDQTGKTVTTAGDTKIKYTEDYRSCIFKDETGKFPYPVGSAKVDFMAIGSGVGYFDGGGNVCTVTSNDFAVADNELFSFEGYGRLNSLANDYATPFGAYYAANTGWMVYFCPPYMGTGGAAMYPYVEGAIYYWNFTVPINSWFHFSWTRDASENVRFFLNGVLQLTSTGAEYHNLGGAFAYGTDFGIGGGPTSYAWGTYCWRGLLDNIRISKGVARYTATFNPPDDYEEESTGTHRMFMVF